MKTSQQTLETDSLLLEEKVDTLFGLTTVKYDKETPKFIMTGGRVYTHKLNHRISQNLVWISNHLMVEKINTILFFHLTISNR